MADKEDKKGILPQIIVAVVVALLVGGTSPWWWKEITKPGKVDDNPADVHHPASSVPPDKPHDGNPAKTPPDQPVSGGQIAVTATANPPVVSPHQQTTINVYVLDSQGQPLPSAIVTLSAGGGGFIGSGTTTVSGQTDSSGAFQGHWSCDYCARAYVGSVRVTKTGYLEAKSDWRVDIQ